MKVEMGLLLISLVVCGLTSVAIADYTDPHCANGTVGIVHLFEWKWTDIETECPLLFQSGFCGVQTSIPTEHLVRNPPSWLERYLPVSYDLVSRSGNEEEFYRMVQACNAVGVRIFVTLQLDYMSPEEGVGYNGTDFDTASLDFPGVPYNAKHFHSKDQCSDPPLKSSSSSTDMQKCWVLGYPNLNQASEHVRNTIVNLLNKFISMGVAGFFLTDAMHIAPEDILGILEKLDDVEFGGRPFMTYEMINTLPTSIDPKWFYPMGRVTDYSMSEVLGDSILESQDLSGLCLLLDSSNDLIPREYASVLAPDHAVVFVHDVSYQRGRSPPWVKVVTFKEYELYQLALSFLFASGYGVPKVMSSYNFTDPDQGPPTDTWGNVLDVTQGSEKDCMNEWICEHRFSSVKTMLKFNAIHRNQEITNCKADKTTVSFSKGDEGHFWATLGPLDKIWDDLPKVRKWDSINNEYVTKVRSDGLEVMDFGGVASAVFYTGSLSLEETTPTAETASPTTIGMAETEPVKTLLPITKEPTTSLETTSEPTTLLPTTNKPTTLLPTTNKPTTLLPTTEKPTTVLPTTNKLKTIISTTNKPRTTITTTKRPTTTATTTKRPTTTATTAKRPTTTAITAKRLTTTVTTTTVTTTKKPTTTATTTKKPTTTTTTTTKRTTTTTKKPKLKRNFRRTVILIQKETDDGQTVFIQGGNGNPAVTNKAIPIKHLDLKIRNLTPERDNWIKGDLNLDWKDREPGQKGRNNRGKYAKGTPAQWTTKWTSANYYSELNTYGRHYWLVHVRMDCSKTDNGFFEVRGVMNTGLKESAKGLGVKCRGGKDIPRASNYHLGMCGKVNVFDWGKKECIIKDL